MKRYSRKEDEIIVKTVKKYAKVGAPLNILAALSEAGDIIYSELGIDRTDKALVFRYYNVLKKKYRIFGYLNTKNMIGPKDRSLVVPAKVVIGGKAFTLTLNLAPAMVRQIMKKHES